MKNNHDFFNFHLYPVITEKFCKNKSSIKTLKQIIKADIKIVQMREKEYSKKEIIDLAYKYRKITKKAKVKLIINDHIDAALLTGADGVHLGQDDLPCKEARKIAPNLIIGVSTHNLKEALQAEKDGADYINIGPVFSTNTKIISGEPLGIEMIRLISSKINIPFTVMGGIKENNIEAVIKAGASRIAIVTEITKAKDIKHKILNLRNKITENIKKDSYK